MRKIAYDDAVLEAIERGGLIELGWQGYASATVPKTATPDELCVLRRTFHAGAVHLFVSIMSALNNEDSHDVDLARMRSIEDELIHYLDSIALVKH